MRAAGFARVVSHRALSGGIVALHSGHGVCDRSATVHARLFRLAHARGFVFAREGVLALVDPAPLPAPARLGLRFARLFERPTDKSAGGRLSAALTRLGPTYVKLGQFLATRPDVVGVAFARDLESLQDKMAPFPQAEAEAAVAAALGNPAQRRIQGVRTGGRRRFDRAGAQGRDRRARSHRGAGRREGAAPRRRTPAEIRPPDALFRGAHRRAP